MIGIVHLSPGSPPFLDRYTLCSSNNKETTIATIARSVLFVDDCASKNDGESTNAEAAAPVDEGNEAEAEE